MWKWRGTGRVRKGQGSGQAWQGEETMSALAKYLIFTKFVRL
ncbi:MAG: hypothetical protein ACUVWN_04580 [bacterium]